MEDKKQGGWKIHLIIALIILLIIGFGAYKLIVWNASDTELEEVEDGSFDYESLDVVFNVDKEILEEHGQDGINNILCIGDDLLIKNDYVGGDSILDIMRKEIENSEITALSLVGTLIADAQNSFLTNEVTPWQAGNLYDVVYALCNNNFELQKKALDREAIIDQKYYDTLTSVDMDKVDTVFIIYSSVDYVKSSTLYNPDNDYDTSTYEGALRAAITTLKSTYPHIRIVLGSPFLHGVIGYETVDSATTVNYGNGNLSEYIMRSYNIAMECCISYEDNFFGLINEETINYYCNVDTLNNEGIRLIANHIVEYFEKKY